MGVLMVAMLVVIFFAVFSKGKVTAGMPIGEDAAQRCLEGSYGEKCGHSG